MAAYLLSPPGMPWTDANGDPLNGGLIYVYQAGTSTLTDSYPTYADAVARTNPNTNPVVLNATGLPSSGGSTIGIWLASGLYKIIVRNSAGVLIQTQDSVGDNTGTDVLPPNYLAGLDVAVNSTDPDHDVDIASGWARDAADSEDMILLSALTKQIDAPWAVGTNAGGLDTGSLSANTQYYVWLIKRTDTGVVDVLFSTSNSSPTMPANYDKKRVIGRLGTDSSANIEIIWRSLPAVEAIGTDFQQDWRKSLAVSESVDVTHYGATGDGTTDDSAAFQAAVNTGQPVYIPPGTYAINSVTLTNGTEIRGAGRADVTIKVNANSTGAFTWASGERVRISGLTCTAASGVTNAQFFLQTNRTEHSAYCVFEDIITYRDLERGWDGNFIYCRWQDCNDGQDGNPVGGQTHGMLRSSNLATGGSQSNMNLMVNCQAFLSNDANAAIYIADGWRWLFIDCGFEQQATPAVWAHGIIGCEFIGCWFEANTNVNMLRSGTTGAPNTQSTWMTLRDCAFFVGASTTTIVTSDANQRVSFTGCSFAGVPATTTLTTDVAQLWLLENNSVLSGTNLLAAYAGIRWPGTASFVTVTALSDDAGAAGGPDVILDRDSASPGASDVLGRVIWRGEDSGGNDEDYAQAQAVIIDPAAASEDAYLSLQAKLAGSMTEGLRVLGGSTQLPDGSQSVPGLGFVSESTLGFWRIAADTLGVQGILRLVRAGDGAARLQLGTRGGNVPQVEIRNSYNAAVSTAAVGIEGFPFGGGGVVIVVGQKTTAASVGFVDVRGFMAESNLGSATYSILAQNIGAVASRTYSFSGTSTLQLTMGADTYLVTVLSLLLRVPT